MKAEHLKQLTLTFEAFGLTCNEIAQVLNRAGITCPSREKTTRHKRRCVVLARAISRNTDPFIKRILWDRFKKLQP